MILDTTLERVLKGTTLEVRGAWVFAIPGEKAGYSMVFQKPSSEAASPSDSISCPGNS